MGDIEKLCSRVMIIDHGSLLYDGPTETLKQTFGGRRTLVVYAEEDWNPAVLDAFDTDWRTAFAVEKVENDQNRVTFAFDPRRTAVSDLIAAVAERIPVRDLLVEDVPIEEVVRSIYLHSEQLREAAGGLSGLSAAGARETG
jgi:ABC-2 type transport system ATP-binding protein